MSDQAGWALAGAALPLFFGFAHAALAVTDVFRPRFFTPVDSSVQASMRSTSVALIDMARMPGRRPPLWDVWLGMNLSHGLGVGGIALIVAVAAAAGDLPALPWLLPLATAWAALMVIVAVRFWFLGPVIITASAFVFWSVALITG